VSFVVKTIAKKRHSVPAFSNVGFENTLSEKIRKGELTWDEPQNLCPFTVDIYPEVLCVGDPLYVRLNFHNNTNMDTYAYAKPMNINWPDAGHVIFRLKVDQETIPWWTYNGFNDAALGMIPLWQKITHGEMGRTQYMPLGFPGVAGMFTHYCYGYDKERWQEIGEISPGMEVKGQLVVIIRGGGSFFSRSPNHPTLTVTSSPFVIKPRSKEEMGAIRNRGRDGWEHIIPQMTPGTLQNIFTYWVLRKELNERAGKDPLSETDILETLEKMKKTFCIPS